jgi:hypothetical protein
MVKKIKLKSSRKRLVEKPSVIRKEVVLSPIGRTQRDAWIFWILFLAFCVVTITFPSFNWIFPDSQSHVFFYGSWQIALFLLGALFLYALWARFSSPGDEIAENDISSSWARFGLLITLILTTGLYLYHMDKPTGEYGIWTDTFSFIEVVRRMKDLWDFRDLWIMGNNNGILPAWPYTALFFWHLFPSDTGLEIQRLTCAFYGFGTVWAIYFCGKEIAGRRVGLLAAALATVSKPLLSKVVSGYPASEFVFAVVLVIWSQIRLMRKNSIGDFLLWIASIVFLVCTAPMMLVLVPFFIFSSLGLLWWKNRNQMTLSSAPYFVWISVIAFLIYFLCCLNAFSNGDRIVSQIKYFSPLIFFIVFVIIVIFYQRLISKKPEELWFKWFCGAWFVVFLSFWTFTSDFFVQRVKYHSLMSGTGVLNPAYLSEAFFQKLPDAFKGLFWSYPDRGDMGLPGDSIFSYAETIFIALGLVFYLVKPDMKRSFLLAVAIVAIIPHFAMSYNYSIILIGCVPPLLLIGAMGLNDLLGKLLGAVRGTFFKKLICFLLIAFWIWAAQGVFSRVYPQWAEKGNHYALPRDLVLNDIARGHRVYLSRELFDYSPEFYEGSSVYRLHQSNPINIDMNEKVPDVVVYFVNEEINILKIYKAFPDLKMDGIDSPYNPGGPTDYRCVIPANRLSDKSQNLFSVVRTPDPVWKRTYNYHINLIRGSIDFSRVDWADRVVDVRSPLPEVAWEGNSDFEGQAYKLQTTIHINRGGKYEITCKTRTRTKMIIDGNVIFNLKFLQIGNFYQAPAANRKVTLNLTTGDHQVEVIALTQPPLPDITLRATETAGESQSLWKGFSFN